jgi:transmembrane sensor
MGTILPFSNESTPEEEAQQWIIRIDRAKLSADERARLRAWLARDPRHGQLLDEHAKLWHAAGKARAVEPAAPAMAANNPSWRHRGAAAGVLAASIAAIAVWFVPANTSHDPSQVLQTAMGQHQRYAMNDGSHIELNTKSRAVVRYEKARREIVLAAGEGWFEVAKDKSRPFTVVAGNTSVRAVGTRFSVHRAENGKVDVVVSEGIVQVTQQTGTAPAMQARLVAGEALAATAGKLAVSQVSTEKMAQLLAWQQGRVTFDDTPLAAALAEMSRYGATPMTAGDPRAASVKVSGSFATNNVDAFLRAIELGFNLKIVKRGEAYVIVSRSKT